MRSFKLPVLFCEPSFASGILVVVSTIGLLFLSNYSYLLRSDLITNTFSPDSASVDVILASRGTVDTFRSSVLSNPVLNRVLFFGFWMMVGLFVYVTLAAIWDNVSKASTELQSTHYVHARQQLIQERAVVRLAMQGGGVLALIIFSILFSSLLYPFSVLSTRVGFSQLNTFMGWGYALLGFTVMLLSLHCYVIIGRMIMARPRMIGGWDSVLTKQTVRPLAGRR